MTTLELVGNIARNLGVGVPSLRIPKSMALACAFPFDIVARVTGADLPLTAKRIDKFTSPTHHDASRILDAGFRPPCSLEEGISRTVSWYKADRELAPHNIASGAA
jgi:nucleoside-diphosphate-sugar epimerase